jgi:hypothetical protein
MTCSLETKQTVAASQSKAPQFEDRVRFNWGFHDGTLDAEQGWNRSVDGHFDAVYAAGFLEGRVSFRASGAREATSEHAWARYVTVQS